MNNEKDASRDQLYIAWVEDNQSSKPKPLQEWTGRYPEHADELIEWAAATVVAESYATYTVSVDEQNFVSEIGRRVAARMRAQSDAPVRSLLGAAKLQGLDVDAMVEQAGLSEPLFMKLERRLLLVNTLPATLFERIAAVLRLSVKQVQDYVSLPPALAAGALYRSEAAPRADQQTFEEAIRSDYELTEDQKQFWLTCNPADADQDR